MHGRSVLTDLSRFRGLFSYINMGKHAASKIPEQALISFVTRVVILMEDSALDPGD